MQLVYCIYSVIPQLLQVGKLPSFSAAVHSQTPIFRYLKEFNVEYASVNGQERSIISCAGVSSCLFVCLFWMKDLKSLHRLTIIGFLTGFSLFGPNFLFTFSF